MSKKLHIFCVGGTIDKIYFDAKSKYEVGAPAIGRILREHDVSFAYQVTSLMAKDSLDMVDEDRQILRQSIAAAEESKIVITHGTDTMVQTAQALEGLAGKTIVLTGALAPAIFKDSDATFNIGCAVAAAQMAPAGIYIAMNGRIFEYDKVTKDVENNRFVAL